MDRRERYQKFKHDALSEAKSEVRDVPGRVRSTEAISSDDVDAIRGEFAKTGAVALDVLNMALHSPTASDGVKGKLALEILKMQGFAAPTRHVHEGLIGLLPAGMQKELMGHGETIDIEAEEIGDDGPGSD